MRKGLAFFRFAAADAVLLDVGRDRPAGGVHILFYNAIWCGILNSTTRKVAGVTEMKNRIIDIIFLTVFVSINLWAILTKNYSNSFLAGIAGMCLVTAILYLRKGKK